LLSLPTLSSPLALLALALTTMSPTTPQYATAPYISAFNWPSIVSTYRRLWAHHHPTAGPLPHTETYIIVFRSRVPMPHLTGARLGELDEKAHEEANNGAV